MDETIYWIIDHDDGKMTVETRDGGQVLWLGTEQAAARALLAHDDLVMALHRVAEFTGDGPLTTPWREIVRDLGSIARAALAKAGAP